MAKMIFEMDNDLEQKIRKTVADIKGLHKRVIKESLEEAIQEWMNNRIKPKVKKHE